jgi:protoporphyrinogen oxidase
MSEETEETDQRVVELTKRLAETVERANGLEKTVEQLKADQVLLTNTIRVLSKVLPP